MMKLAYPIGLGLTAFAGLPAAMSPQSLQGSTQEALASTMEAIDEMLMISKAIERREPGSIQRVLDSTQAPTIPLARQDEFLSQLRLELSDLQQQIDRQAQVKAEIAASASAVSKPQESKRPQVSRPRSEVQSTPSAHLPDGQLEPNGYVADSLRQGRLLFRDGQYEEAIKVLAAIEGNPEAKYWEARSYESLGHVKQAIRRYNALIDNTTDESIARRAAHDLSFLEWKQRFYGAENKKSK